MLSHVNFAIGLQRYQQITEKNPPHAERLTAMSYNVYDKTAELALQMLSSRSFLC